MASFKSTGIEGLLLSMEEFSQIPEEVVQEIVEAGGAVVKEAHQAQIQQLNLIDSGTLHDSIQAFTKVGRKKDFQRYVVVYPAGDHHTYKRKKVTKVYANSKSGRTYTYGGDTPTVTNSEVGFVHEFGAPERNIKAKQWMRKANEGCGSALEEAEASAYYKWLDTLNL